MNEFDKEILDTLGGKLLNSSNSDEYFSLVEKRYPIGLNRIDWTLVPKHYELFLTNEKNKENRVRDFLNDLISEYPSICSDTVIVWGDNAIDLAYRLKYVDFKEHCMLFFDLPQHSYVWLEKSKKLINYTFEDDLYFG